jgi:hypothetical protein
MRIAVAVGLALVACTLQPGLSNAPSINRLHTPTESNDVITNGPDSCERGDGGSPMPNRLPPCTEPSSVQATGR